MNLSIGSVIQSHVFVSDAPVTLKGSAWYVEYGINECNFQVSQIRNWKQYFLLYKGKCGKLRNGNPSTEAVVVIISLLASGSGRARCRAAILPA